MIKEILLASTILFIPANFDQAAEEEVYPGWQVGCEGIDQLISDVDSFRLHTKNTILQIEEALGAGAIDVENVDSAANSHNILVMILREVSVLEQNVLYFRATNCRSQ
jgi:hypothetical protein